MNNLDSYRDTETDLRMYGSPYGYYGHHGHHGHHHGGGVWPGGPFYPGMAVNPYLYGSSYGYPGYPAYPSTYNPYFQQPSPYAPYPY